MQDKYVRYTVEFYRPMGDADGIDVHQGNGGTAAGMFREALLNAINEHDTDTPEHQFRVAASNAFVVGRGFVDAVPEYLTDDPVYESDPDPDDEIRDLIAKSRAKLKGLVDE